MVMTRDQAIIALAAWQLAQQQQVRSFNRVVRGREQHVRAFERRGQAPGPLTRDMAARVAGRVPPSAPVPPLAKVLAAEIGVKWRAINPDMRDLPQLNAGAKVVAGNGPARVIGTLVAISGIGAAGHGHGHAVIESGDTGLRYLVKIPGGEVEQSQPLGQGGRDPVLWANRLLNGAPAPGIHTVPEIQPPPDRTPGGGWIPPDDWAQGQLEWIERGEDAWQRGGWMIVYERDNSQPFGRLNPRGQMDRPSREELRAWLVKQAPRPPVQPRPGRRVVVAPSQFGRGAPEVRRLTAEVAQLPQSKPDAYHPSFGSQALVKIRDLPDGTKVVTKVTEGYGEDAEGLDREELAFYVSQAIGAGVPAVVRLPDSRDEEGDLQAGIAEEFVPGTVGAEVLRDAGTDMARYSAQLNEMYRKGRMTIGLLDYLIANLDRNNANFIVKDDGTLVPIDHGISFEDTSTESPFAGDAAMKAFRKMGDARVDELAANLGQVRAEFTRLDHSDWYLFVMKNLASLRSQGLGMFGHDRPQGPGEAIWKRALTQAEYSQVWG